MTNSVEEAKAPFWQIGVAGGLTLGAFLVFWPTAILALVIGMLVWSWRRRKRDEATALRVAAVTSLIIFAVSTIAMIALHLPGSIEVSDSTPQLTEVHVTQP